MATWKQETLYLDHSWGWNMFSLFGYISSISWQLVLHSPLAFEGKIYCLRTPHSQKTTRPRKQQQTGEQKHQQGLWSTRCVVTAGTPAWWEVAKDQAQPACRQGSRASRKENACLVPLKSLRTTFFRAVGYQGLSDLSLHSLPQSFSTGFCTQAVVSRTFSSHADAHKRWKGEPLLLEGEAEETVTWWGYEQWEWRNEKYKVFARAVTYIPLLSVMELDSRVGRHSLVAF